MMLSLVMPIVLIAYAGRQERPLPHATPSAAPAAAAALSRRALRNARLLIELRMLELRKARLECVRAALLRRLPPDLLPTGSPAPGVKQSDAFRATSSSNEECRWISILQRRRRLPA